MDPRIMDLKTRFSTLSASLLTPPIMLILFHARVARVVTYLGKYKTEAKNEKTSVLLGKLFKKYQADQR
jgi:hypothetical protein